MNVACLVDTDVLSEGRRGVEVLRHRHDTAQADRLEKWLALLLDHYRDRILDFGEEEAQVWGRLRVPHAGNALDKQIAATALTHGLSHKSADVTRRRKSCADLATQA
jgi:predicted nucleic acid-binding protein